MLCHCEPCLIVIFSFTKIQSRRKETNYIALDFFSLFCDASFWNSSHTLIDTRNVADLLHNSLVFSVHGSKLNRTEAPRPLSFTGGARQPLLHVASVSTVVTTGSPKRFLCHKGMNGLRIDQWDEMFHWTVCFCIFCSHHLYLVQFSSEGSAWIDIV